MVVNLAHEKKDGSGSPSKGKPYLHLKFFGGPCQGEVQ